MILDVDEDFRNRTVQLGNQYSNVHHFGGCVGDGDAIITSQKRILLCTRTADCVPILLYNSEQVAVVHAGWRGIANEILPKCVAQMFSVDGVIVGPCISQQNYEVDIDVIDAFEKVGFLERMLQKNIEMIAINKNFYSMSQRHSYSTQQKWPDRFGKLIC